MSVAGAWWTGLILFATTFIAVNGRDFYGDTRRLTDHRYGFMGKQNEKVVRNARSRSWNLCK